MPPNLREDAKKMAVKLDPQLETLAERFKAAGYATIGVSPNPWITGEFGYNQGFDTFYVKERMVAEEVVRAGEKFISTALENNQPFFAYLHFLDPHDPYQPPGEFKDTFQGAPPGGRVYGEAELQMINLYDGELRYLDTQLERFFSFLKQRGIYDDVSIILVADHGEQFRERGEQGHGHQLFNEEVHVPLIVKSPKATAGSVIEVTASTVDVFKTALAAAEIPAPQDGPGVSLFDQAALEARRGVLSEIDRIRRQRAYTTSDGVKVIVESPAAADGGSDAGGAAEQFRGLFNWRTDYLETGAAAADPELVATLRAELQAQRTQAAQGRVQGEVVTGEIKDSTIEQLKTLGYLQ
jgi:arylsulfatase A-like enzyme